MRKWLLTPLLIFLSFTLTACNSLHSQVAYTVYPLGYLTQRIAGDQVHIASVQNETISQRAQFNADAIQTIEASDVFLHIGTLEPYLTLYQSKIEETGTKQLDLSIMNAVYNHARYTRMSALGVTNYIESPYYEGDIFSTIDQDTKDLYLWLDPIAMLSMAENIKDWLNATYPDHAQVFDANYTALETDLINLDAQYQALATQMENNGQTIRFVSLTDSFGNWQKTYGIQVYPIVLSKYGALPNVEQLKAEEERIKADGVKYIVYEPNMPEDMIELFNQIESDLNLTRVELSNLSSLTQEQKDQGKDYLSIMYENLAVLQTMVQEDPQAQISNTPKESQPANNTGDAMEQDAPHVNPETTEGDIAQ